VKRFLHRRFEVKNNSFTFLFSLILGLIFSLTTLGQVDVPGGAINWGTFDGEYQSFLSPIQGIACSCQGAGCTTASTCEFNRGKVGQGVGIKNPNGDGTVIITPSDGSNSPTDGLTIEGWFKINDVNSPYNYQQTLVSKRLVDQDFYFNQSYLLEVLDGQPRARHGCTGGNNDFINASTFINSNTWYHIAYTIDPTANRQHIYVNGVNYNAGDSHETSDLGLCYDNSPLIFGGTKFRDDTFGNFFDGSMDEVTLYNRALSLSEIQTIYADGIKGKKKQKGIAPGSDVFAHLGDLDLTFQLVSTGGSAQQTPIDLNDYPALPPNTDPVLGYDVTTTTIHSGNLTLCYHLPLINDAIQFSRLQILHLENGVWVNRTTSRNFPQRQLCGVTSSLSPFAIVDNLAPSAATVSISGRVLTADGRGISNAVVTLTNSSGATIRSRTGSLGYFSFSDLAAGETYVISVNSKRYNFANATQVLNVSEDIADLHFIGLDY